MSITLQLPPLSISEKWNIESPFFKNINYQSVDFKIIGANLNEFSAAIFYCHGLGGSIDDCLEINDLASSKKPIIRISSYGLKPPQTLLNLSVATFGDLCTLLYNSRQAVIGIANILGLSNYQILGQSWGGFTALLTGLKDKPCQKSMLLVSTPDICDAITCMGNLIFQDNLLPAIINFMTPGMSWDANSAKFGKAIHQTAWNVINPYQASNNPDLDLLIFNREEDKVMRKNGVLHFINFCQNTPIANVSAKFISDTTKSHHEMPFDLFKKDLYDFLDLD